MYQEVHDYYSTYLVVSQQLKEMILPLYHMVLDNLSQKLKQHWKLIDIVSQCLLFIPYRKLKNYENMLIFPSFLSESESMDTGGYMSNKKILNYFRHNFSDNMYFQSVVAPLYIINLGRRQRKHRNTGINILLCSYKR